MRFVRSQGLLALGLGALLALAGCGVSTGAAGGNGAVSTPTATATSTSGAFGAGIVATATATVGGKATTILTDAAGRSLYYFADDSATASACTTGCTSTWPPLLISSGAPTSASTLSGTLSARDVGNGQQALYNGHPLYRYGADAAAGDTNGDGIAGKWHVTTPGVAVNQGATGPTPTPCPPGAYCY